jgi:DtxR family Mn-dependent transcriptional regulator
VANDGFHPPIEEYLEALHEMEEEHQDLVQVRLAERLGHTPASVSEMVKRLVGMEHLTVTGRTLALTESGRAIAQRVVRKHRLAERLLTDIIGMDWHVVHEEACRWEHVMSDEVEQRLVTLLGEPQTCPHGNPIPGLYTGTETLVPLSSVAAGSTVTIRRITETIEIDQDLLTYVWQHGVTPGSTQVVLSIADNGDIRLGDSAQSDKACTLSASTARAILVAA